MNERRPYEPERDEPMLSAYVDGELDSDARALVEDWIESDAHAREEVDRLVQMKAFTDHLALRPAPEEAWDRFHARRGNRYQRGLGWVLFWAGTGIVGGYLAIRVVVVVLALALPLLVRLGLAVAGVGLLILLISAVRERFFVRKRDRYDDVIR